MIEDIYALLKEDNLSFFYRGSFGGGISNALMDINEINMDQLDQVRKIRKRVYYLMVECLQNVERHANEIYELNKNFFFTRNCEGEFYISTGNRINTKNQKELKEKLDQINELSGDDLNQLYIEILNHGQLSERGGAGLGLIEMARKSKQKIDYSFEEINAEESLFYIQLKLKTAAVDTPQAYQNMDEVKQFYTKLMKADVSFLYKGDFSHESIKPMLQTLLGNISQVKGQRMQVFHLMVEILQNMNRYTANLEGANNGLFMVAERPDGQLEISALNTILDEDIEKLRGKLEELSLLDNEALEKLYKNRLVESLQDSIEDSAGLGLIDVFRYASKGVNFDFVKSSEGKSLFLLKVCV